jgi:hypothetical protein
MLKLLHRPLEERRYLCDRRQAAPPRGLYIRRLNAIVLRDDASVSVARFMDPVRCVLLRVLCHRSA